MQRLLHEGMDAGLCGFSIQRLGPNSVQADFDGSPMVTDTMGDEDILALAEVLRERDEGFIQITQATGDIKADLAFLEKLAAAANRPILHNVDRAGAHRSRRSIAGRCAGSKTVANAACRSTRSAPPGAPASPSRSSTGTCTTPRPAWRAVTTGTHEEKIAKMQDPTLRKALVDEAEAADRRLRAIQAGVGGNPKGLIVQSVERSPRTSRSTSARASATSRWRENKHPIEVMLDLSLAGDLNVEFLGPDKGSNADFMAEMITESEYAIPGVSDGGAHTKFFTGGAYTTDFLTWLVRDEGRVSLEEAHYRLSTLPAHAAGFSDRGVLERAPPPTSSCTTWTSSPSIRRGSAASSTICRPASGAGCSGPWATSDHRQRADHVRVRRVHRRDARQAAAPRTSRLRGLFN